MDVTGTGSIDSEVKKGRAIAWPADVIGSLAAISDQSGVDTLSTVESRGAGGFVINKEVTILTDVALSRCIGTEFATSCTDSASTSCIRNDVLSKSSACSVQLSLVTVVVASG